MTHATFGFQVAVIEDTSRGVGINGSIAAAWKGMLKAGVVRVRSSDILAA